MRFSARNPDPPHASRHSCSASSACHVDSAFRPAASVSRSWRLSSVSFAPLKTASNFCSSSSCANAWA
jgi:hypothetical protein